MVEDFRPEGEDAFFGWLRAIANNRLTYAVLRARRKKRGGEAHRVRADRDVASTIADLLDLLAPDTQTSARTPGDGQAARGPWVGVSVLYARPTALHFSTIVPALAASEESFRPACAFLAHGALPCMGKFLVMRVFMRRGGLATPWCV